jgi:hypothetical protein
MHCMPYLHTKPAAAGGADAGLVSVVPDSMFIAAYIIIII